MDKEILKRWKEKPAKVPEEEHQQECGGYGYVYLEDGSALKCPVCSFRAMRQKLIEQMEAAGISKRYLLTEWDELTIRPPLDHIKRATENIERVLDSGTSAIFSGPPGTGKSTAAAMMAKATIAIGKRAHMANIGRVSTLVRARYDGGDGWTEAQAIEWLSEPELLVLDDLGAGETREGTHENKILYLSLEQRQANGLITIVTTNLPEELLRKRIGERVMNRLMPYKVFRFTGENWRRKKAADWSID